MRIFPTIIISVITYVYLALPSIARENLEQQSIKDFALLQTYLEHIAGNESTSEQRFSDLDPEHVWLGQAYTAYIHNNIRRMDLLLSQIHSKLDLYLRDNKLDASAQEELQAYMDKLRKVGKSESALTRLTATLREVGGNLFFKATSAIGVLESRHVYGMRRAYPTTGLWLRLPCRTLAQHAEETQETLKNLGRLAGPLFSCPVTLDDERPYPVDQLARWVAHPEDFPIFTPTKKKAAPQTKDVIAKGVTPSLPWDRDAAVRFMIANPEEAERVLKHTQEQDPVGKLDYALFLFAFKPKTNKRDALIHKLTEELLSIPIDDKYLERPHSYNGHSGTLIEIIRYLSSAHITETQSAFYAIPCDVLKRKPNLIEATSAYYGSNRDNFTPRSGCSYGRGTTGGFPKKDIINFLRASQDADGHLIDNQGGSVVFGYMSQQSHAIERLRLDIPGLLSTPLPPFNTPYELWANAGPMNRIQHMRITTTYRQATRALDNYYRNNFGLTTEQAHHVAKVGLFELVFGASCGAYPPSRPTLRGLIMNGASVQDIQTRLDAGVDGETIELLDCGNTAPLSPLIHVATLNPPVLKYLLTTGHDPDQPNDFGKTPLMTAAQYNIAESVSILLRHKPDLYHATFRTFNTLWHDQRTALMYAAENGSLEVIQMLLTAGADKFQSDTKGARAIDYLLGFGITNKVNSNLSPEEIREAKRILF